MHNKHDATHFKNQSLEFNIYNHKGNFHTLFLNNRRKRVEEKGLSLWDAISVL